MSIGQELDTQAGKRAEAEASVAAFVSGMGRELQRALPKHMDGDRVARIALTLIRQSDLAKQKGITTTSLSECTTHSFAAALLTASALGLEPGVNGEAWLIPYRDTKARIVECTLQIGYQGMQKLAYQHPLVKRVASGYVCEKDHFEFDLGVPAYIEHRPAVFADRGEVIGYWAAVELTTGGVLPEVLSVEQCKALRGKIGPNGKIADPQHWMERKTVLKQALKSAPRSVLAHWAHRVDETSGTEMYVAQVPQQIAEAKQIESDVTKAFDGPATPEGDDPWAEGDT